jgi:hypothetical protein
VTVKAIPREYREGPKAAQEFTRVLRDILSVSRDELRKREVGRRKLPKTNGHRRKQTKA